MSREDVRRANNVNVVVLEERDLDYYFELSSHLGPAAKYQLLSDLLPGKPVPGLQIRVPAIKTRMGPYVCYAFSISPEYLLKIAFVSHRAKGTDSDALSYQRMIKPLRLKAIRKFLDKEDSLFPTNIVLNIEKGKLKFYLQGQETDQQNGVLGWLDIKANYKSAWIIDGQHRLFAYSGHPKASTSRLAVLAFASLPPEKQATLFIDINAEQKSVPQSLLQQLYAVFNWNAALEKDRVAAVASRAIKDLNTERDSPFYQRIVSSDERRDPIRCITMPSIFEPLAKRADLYIVSSQGDASARYGPLWVEGDMEATVRRTVYVVKNWFNAIRSAAPQWWDAGKGEGGGLAMNDSVTALLLVLKSVLLHVSEPLTPSISNEQLWERVRRFSDELAKYIASLSEEERQQFRSMSRGIQGQTSRMRQCQRAINAQIADFQPEGLQAYIREAEAQTNVKAKAITDKLELMLQQTVLEELKREYGSEESQWWMNGVPSSVRKKVSNTYEEDNGSRGSKEFYLDLLDYRRIILDNWNIFADLLGYGKPNASKDKRTDWIDDINDSRKIVAHPSSGRSVSLDQLDRLQELEKWLNGQLSGRLATEESA
jgi:DGQHR domain-containing protein